MAFSDSNPQLRSILAHYGIGMADNGIRNAVETLTWDALSKRQQDGRTFDQFAELFRRRAA